MVALTSHLPHLIAYVHGGWAIRTAVREFAGPGLQFRGSPRRRVDVAREIIAENRAAVSAQYDGWVALLTAAGDLLRDGRFDELNSCFPAGGPRN
jgi:prephenate dehydrogenase